MAADAIGSDMAYVGRDHDRRARGRGQGAAVTAIPHGGYTISSAMLLGNTDHEQTYYYTVDAGSINCMDAVAARRAWRS